MFSNLGLDEIIGIFYKQLMIFIMKIKFLSGRRNFEIENENGQRILKLYYENWLSKTAKARLNGADIEIKRKSLWKSTYSIYENSIEVGAISGNWKGEFIIAFRDETFLLKIISIWKSDFELLDEKKERLFILKSNWSWKNFKYNYHMKRISERYDASQITELLLYSGFGIHLYRSARMAS